jgi:hypothetical protein
MKIEGKSKEFDAAITRLMQFYKYDEVVGVEELMEL